MMCLGGIVRRQSQVVLFIAIAQVLGVAAALAQPPEPAPEPPPTTEAPPTTTDPSPPVTTEPPAEPPEQPPTDPPPDPVAPPKLRRNFAGSIQLDYMAVPSEDTARDLGFDGATAEVSLKIAMDFGSRITSSVKVCVACHGFEVGMAFFDIRIADELNFRVGRFTPSFGEFPLRHDPANHRTSDKPLPYDMGRMLRMNDFNQGVLPRRGSITGSSSTALTSSARTSSCPTPRSPSAVLVRRRIRSTSTSSCRAPARPTTSTTTRVPSSGDRSSSLRQRQVHR